MVAQATETSMQRLRLAAVGTLAQLTFYPPGLRQPAHSHERGHVSIIVAGSLHEVSAGRDQFGCTLQLNLRPCDSTHEVQFGPQGALILSVDVEGAEMRRTASGWVHRGLSPAQRMLLGWVLNEGVAGGKEVGDCIQDLVAGIEEESLRGRPPRWLIGARDRLMEDPAARIDSLAGAASVHRAHFARAFQHWFKTPPSVFRRRAMLSRAIAAIAAGQSLALAAHTAGFADQSHFCRSMRSMIGTTPHRLLRRAS
jgi:AraC family transcriptional regulator